MKRRINIGVLGCSKIADRAIIPAILQNKHFHLVGVAAREETKALDFAKRFETKAYSYDSLLDSPEIDAIYVSLPVGLHYEWGKKVVSAGKHLLMEKTFTDSYEKAQEIINLALEQNRVAMEALMYIYHPLFTTVKDLIQLGKIGSIRSLEAVFGFPPLPENDIRNQADLGGGAILDNLIYPLSFCLSLANEKEYAYDYRIHVNKAYQVDSRGSLFLHFRDYSAYISYGFGHIYRNEYVIWGSEGMIKVDRGFSRPADVDGVIRLYKQNEEKIIKVPADNHFQRMLDAFSQKIKGKDHSHLNEQQHILGRMRIISDLYKKTKEMVDREDFGHRGSGVYRE